jgi:DNA-binding LacI/PurR family transcriptional regulator
VLEAIERLRVQGVEGILVIAPQEGGARALVQAPSGVPLVALEAGPRDVVPLASVDQFTGAWKATEHLLRLGHRTVWHIGGPAGWPEAEDRVRGWRSALESVRAPVPPPLSGDWSARSGHELALRLVDDPEITALFVANDQMALGALRALHEAGRRVPQDMSVVGFDDIPEAPYFIPPLTTVRQDFDEMGRRGLRLLLDTIEFPDGPPAHHEVVPELVVRASTGPPSP